jgi:hypothetical protein
MAGSAVEDRVIYTLLARRLCVGASAAMATDPLTVRIDLDPG